MDHNHLKRKLDRLASKLAGPTATKAKPRHVPPWAGGYYATEIDRIDSILGSIEAASRTPDQFVKNRWSA